MRQTGKEQMRMVIGVAHIWLKRHYFDPENIHAISRIKRHIAMGLGHGNKGEWGFPGALGMRVFT
jgi:hypothetical protein